uniref:Enoyl reductase (ER) domain-containing protein n=1 Tax=Schistocephalus solidus TaxID=70667 RepID=A0A0X3QBY8_SCHSO
MADTAPAESNTEKAPAEGTQAGKEEEAVPTPPVKQTRSIYLTGFGGPKYVRLQTKEQKTVGKGEIAVEVEACGLGFLDVMTRQGLLEITGKPPFIMGSECCGKVSEVGEGVTKYKVGDEVVVLCDGGAWTERLVITPLCEKTEEETGASSGEAAETKATAVATTAPPAVVLPKPACLTDVQAAVASMSYLPAYFLLHRVACVRPNDVVLVHSAGGGVGTAIGQLAKLIGNVKLVGIASANKHEKLTSLYDQLININQDYVAEVKKEHPLGVTVVLDSRSGEDTNKGISLLQPLGRYVIYGSSNFVTGDRKNLFSFAKSWIQMDRINPLKLQEESKVLGGFSLRSLIFRQHAQLSTIFEAWQELTQLFSEKKIEPIVDSTWCFEEVKEAMQKLQERSNIGKVALNPKLQPKAPEPEVKTADKEEEPKEENKETTS